MTSSLFLAQACQPASELTTRKTENKMSPKLVKDTVKFAQKKIYFKQNKTPGEFAHLSTTPVTFSE